MSTKFEERLAEKRRSPLWGTLSRYQHIERLGSDEVEGLLNGEVIVQEKLDGANVTIAFVADETGQAHFVIATRNQAVSVDGHPYTGFKGLVEYVLANPVLCSIGQLGLILRGEWLVRHSLNYNADAFGQLYIFDVQRLDGTYLHPDEYIEKLDYYGNGTIKYIPVLARLTNPTVEQLVELSQGPSMFGPEKEGIVVKNYGGYRNKYGRVTWGKVVSADFKVKNRLNFGATSKDPAELRFAAKATDEFVLKTLHKVADLRGESPRVQHMAEVLGRAWHDLFTEDLWEFVSKEKVKGFDFSTARNLVIQKVRDTALAFYNGVKSVHSQDG